VHCWWLCAGLRCQPLPRGALFQVAVSQGAPCTSPSLGIQRPWGLTQSLLLPRTHATHPPHLTPIPLRREGYGREKQKESERVWEEEDRARDRASVFLQTQSPMGILSQMKVSKTLYLLILNFKRTLRKYIHSLLRILIRSSDTHPPPNFLHTR